MRRHGIVAALSVVVLIGACSSGGTTTKADASETVTIPAVAPDGSTPPASGCPARLPLPAAPEITDAGVIDGAVMISVAKPHVSEAVEHYQVSVAGGEWRTLEGTEWRPAPGGAGVVVMLGDPAPAPGQAVLVRLRAVSAAGFGVESRAVSMSTGLTSANADPADDGSVDIDTALGLGGATGIGAPDPAQRAFVIIVEVLAAIGLVSIGIIIGWRLRRA